MKSVQVIVESEGDLYYYDAYVLGGNFAITVGRDENVAVLERIVPSSIYPGYYEFAGGGYVEIGNLDPSFRLQFEQAASLDDIPRIFALCSDYLERSA